ncbi:MAG: AMP-binding protein, partial [Candidatus Bathyarchaeia archaeon]
MSSILEDIKKKTTQLEANMQNYDQTYSSFYLDKPQTFNVGFDIIDSWALDRTKLALIVASPHGDKFEKYTFWDLRLLSNRFANLLRTLGAKKGDRLFIMLPKIHTWHVAMIGAAKLGMVSMPATTMCTTRDVTFRIRSAEAKFVITDIENVSKFSLQDLGLKAIITVDGPANDTVDYGSEMKRMPNEIDAETIGTTEISDTAIIWFTSGTEGPPKMVLHTHEYFLSHYITAKFWMDLRPTDVHWTLSDTGWAKATYGYFSGQWLLGATVLQHDWRGKFDPDQTLNVLKNAGVTTFCAPPTAWRMIVRQEFDRDVTSSLRHCTSAGEPLNPEIMRIWKEKTGLTIYDGYGQTETVIMVANFRSLQVKPGSMGKPIPGWDVEIVDEEGVEQPPGTEGFIAARVQPKRPNGLFKEYWKDAETTSSRFKAGFYYTGDRGFKDEDGYFWFVARSDDVIKSAAYR